MSNKDSNKFGQLGEQNERRDTQLAFRLVPDCRAVEARGQEQRLPDGAIVRAVLMTSVRETFPKYYQPKHSADPAGATRAAFVRELHKTTVGPIRCGQWDGHQWLYAVVDPN